MLLPCGVPLGFSNIWAAGFDPSPAGSGGAGVEVIGFRIRMRRTSLTVIGKYRPGQRIAKLARKSAYKAAKRQVTAQRR